MLRRGGQRRGRASLSRLTSTLLSRTRLHGLRQVCLPGGSMGRRAFWLIALCTSVGLLLSWSSNRLLHWLSFPTYTRVHTEWAKELAFPAVTICNNNPIRLYKLTKSDLYFAGHWLGLLLANRTVRPLVLDLLQEDRRAWFNKLVTPIESMLSDTSLLPSCLFSHHVFAQRGPRGANKPWVLHLISLSCRGESGTAP
uniref:Acid-sensing ion channel 2 n=1 Tax=Periophthalmus magnuspinnatus TaxID=409849 RepID=A0A3B4AFB9_9GOBI